MELENLTENEVDGLTLADLAHLLLKNDGECNTAVLYKKIAKIKKMSKNEYEETIADFFAILNTDKRFVILNNGNWGLRENHAIKSNFNDLLSEEDNEILVDDDTDDFTDEDETEEDIELFINEDEFEDDDDDDIADLIIIDEDELNEE